MIRATILGSGTSSGVPRIGNDWGVCDPTNPRNRRRRASILIETQATRILVDTAPDLREQLLDANIASVDAVIWTHDHADHSHGLDDLRQLFHAKGVPISGYGAAGTLNSLRRRFGYAFDGRDGYPATITAQEISGAVRIGNIDVDHVAQPHGGIWSSGLRFTYGDTSVGYATDFHDFTPAMAALYDGLDLLIIDALRYRPHPTHPHLAQTLAAIAQCRPKRAVLTHMDQSMDYATLAADLPVNVQPGYDGLRIECP